MNCPACQHPNRDEARFCDACGTRLAAPATPSVIAASGGQPSTQVANTGLGAIALTGGAAAGARGIAIGGNLLGDIIYNLPPSSPDDTEIEKQYFQWVERKFASLHLRAGVENLANTSARALQLVDVFVDLEVETPSTWRLWSLQLVAASPRLVLLGSPGSGKSSLIAYLMVCLAQTGLGQTGVLERLGEWWKPTTTKLEADRAVAGNGVLLPIYISLPDLAASMPVQTSAGSAEDVWRYLKDKWRDTGPTAGFAGLMERAAAQKGVLFLFDSLDEIALDNQRVRVLEAINDLIIGAVALSRYVLTTRPYAWRGAPARTLENATVARLLPFTRPQISTFVSQWCKTALVRAEWLNVAEANDLHAQLTKELGLPSDKTANKPEDSSHKRTEEEVQKRTALLALMSNPFLVTLLMTIRTTTQQWFEDRVALYDAVVNLILLRRNDNLETSEARIKLTDTVELSLRAMRATLEAVAFKVHVDNVNRPELEAISEAGLLKEFSGLFGDSLDQARLAVDYLENRVGLLLPQSGADVFGWRQFTFPHRAFQEYLAGCHLMQLENPSLEAKRLAQVNPVYWREVLVLGARQANMVRGIPLADALVNHVDVEKYLKRTRPTGPTDNDWRLAIIAAAQLVELGVEKIQKKHADQLPIIERVANWLSYLLANSFLPNAERVEAGELLASLGDLRFRIDFWGLPDDATLGFIEVPATEFEMGTSAESIAHLIQQFNETAKSFEDETPRHRVALARYFIGKYAVTTAQYQTFVKATDHPMRNRNYDKGLLLNQPIVRITWPEALAYSEWLTLQLRGSDETPEPLASLLRLHNWRVTLPTEAQWENAARGQAGGEFPWGASSFVDQANAANLMNRISSVGCFAHDQSTYGVFDLAGNVSEWCHSKYVAYPYVATDGREEERGSDRRVFRGGAFNNPAHLARCAVRGFSDPNERYSSVGFRLCLTSPNVA